MHEGSRMLKRWSAWEG